MTYAVAILLLGSAVVASSTRAQDSGNDSQAVVRSEGFDLSGGAPVYAEEHREFFRAGRLLSMRSIYRGPGGDTLALRSLDFSASSASSTRPAYRLLEPPSGHEEEVAIEQGRVRVRYRASRREEMREKALDVPEPFVIDGGFHAFLKEHWPALTAGEKIAFNFVVPSRLDYFRFLVYQEGKASQGGNDKVFIAVPESRILRLLVPAIITRYDAASHRLLEYRGISNLQGPDGKGRKVRLTYGTGGL